MSPVRFSADFAEQSALPARQLVPPPMRTRRVAYTLVLCFVLGIFFVGFSPWQQNVPGSGKVVAYAPLDRQQVVEAPIKGRVMEWWVQEGSRVEKGDPIARIADNDPMYTERIKLEREALQRQLQAYQEQVASLKRRVDSTTDARDFKLDSAQAKVRSGERKVNKAIQKLKATEAKLKTQVQNLDRHATLFQDGLVSERKVEMATMYEAEARTNRDSASQNVELERQMLQASRADLDEARAQAEAKIDKARSELAKAESSLAAGQAKLNKLDTKLARQETQMVLAPRSGTVLRLLAVQGTEQVKAGDPLAVLVPDMKQRAVEMWVDGNDAALIAPGRHVRLQFEGWPAVQFSGWPSVATGTFGGEVVLVDAASNKKGNFRVLVKPDLADAAWPSEKYLRQGVRANGWVMLDTVSIGFEWWRQLNGFPPTVNQEDSYGGGKKKGKKGGKG